MSGQELTAFQQASLDDRWRYAQAIAQAGNLVPVGLRNDDGSMNAGKVLMAMEQATALGFHPMVGVNNINVIDGKVSLPPALMQAAIRNAGHVLRVRKTGTVEGGDFAVTAILKRSDDDWEFEATWTPQRAARAGLCSYERDVRSGIWMVKAESRYGKALPWQAYTEAMCKARAISEVCMEGATDVLMGAVYTPEELGASVDAGGVVIDHAPAPVAAPSMPSSDAPSTPSAPSAPDGRRESSAPNAKEEISEDVTPDETTDWRALIDAAENSEEVRALWYTAQEQGQFAVDVDGITLREAIERRGALLTQQEATRTVQEEMDADVIDAEVVEETTAEQPKNGAGTDADAAKVPQEGSDVSGAVYEPSPAEDDADAAWLAGQPR